MNINQLSNAILAKKFRYFLLAFLITSHLFSQEIKGLKTFDPSFEHFQLPGGAMGNSVQGIVQDSVGYMWFASQAGLHRYDGRNFITFNTDPNNPNTLISDYIEDIYLDSKGMIWLSHWTGGGLTSYDPDNGIFKQYVSASSDPESILPNETSEIIEDADGYIWVGGSGGISRLDTETGKFKRFYSDPEDPNTLSDVQVRGLYVDKENTLWVATGMQWLEDTLGGLNRYIPETESFERFVHDPDNPASITNNKVRSMFEDSRGNFWIGTGGDGLHTFDKQTGTFTHYPYDPNNPGKISKPVLNNPEQTINPQFSHITSIYEDRTGRLWITSAYTGLNVYDPESETTFHFESGSDENDLKTNFIWQTFQSDDGTIWIATGGEGQEVYKLKEKKLDFPFYETVYFTGDSTSESHGIIKDDNGKIWMGLSNEGPNDTDRSSLWKIDRTAVDIEQIRLGDLNDDSLGWFKGFMGSLTKDQKGNIWVGTDKGYFYGDTETADFKSYRPDYAPLDYFGIPQILSRRNGEIWIANWESGVIRYQPETGDYELFEHDPENPESLFGPIVVSMFEDSKGNIWLGGGSPWYAPEMLLFLDRFNPVTGTFEHFIDETISNGAISDITEDAEGNIWFIDLQDGVYKLNPVNKELRKFTPFNSLLPNEYFHTIFTHPNGNIWINGDYSLIELDPVSESMSVYNELHGIKPARNFWNSGYLAEDGEILFARTGGFHAFNPDDFFSGIKNNLPDLRITGFRLLDDHISSGMTISKGVLEAPIWRTSQIELENTENVFSFSVACFDFYDPEANQIQFMLEGYDRGWREDIRNGETPYYVNVRPGEYIFRLRGANSMGVWNREGISLKIIINPPWYITWWAYVLYGLIFIAGFFGFDRFQRNRLIRREREKTHMRELAHAKEIQKAYTELKTTQTQLIQSEKMASLGELTAGIAHEIQNPLNFVNNFSEVNTELIDEADEEIDKGNISEVKAILKDIKENEQKINHHGQRADAIVKGMLQHSRTSSGQKEPTDLNALADEYLRLAYHGLRAKDKSFNANFKTEFDKSLPKIDVIPQDIGRVILNLITNAFYAVQVPPPPEGAIKNTQANYKPTVIVRTSFIPPVGGQRGAVVVYVSDNGPGIPQNIKDKIFQPFFTTKPTGQGTGLGLSLSYDIIKAHGGTIAVKSKENVGTEFIIQLPVK